MPELTPVLMQQCVNETSVAEIGGYSQIMSVTGDFDSCTCQGFRFRRRCKHLDEARKSVCGWHELYGDAQTDEQRAGMICPQCGGSTRHVRVGV